MRRIYFILSLFVFAVMSSSAQSTQTKHYKMFGPGVFITVDRGAMFQGSGSVDGFQRYIGKRFVYTGELWKQLHCRSFHVECTITSTGQVIDVSVKMPAADANGNMVDAPQAVTDQISILCREMPKWIPAVVKGRNVSSRFFTTISVVDELQDVESYGNRRYTALPYNLVSIVTEKRKIVEDRVYNDGAEISNIKAKLNQLENVMDIVPEYARTSSGYVRMLVSIGKYSEAYNFVRDAANLYKKGNDWNEKYEPSIFVSFPHKGGYEGKTEVWMQLLKTAVAIEANLAQDTLDRVFSDAQYLVNVKIANHDIENVNMRIMNSGDYTSYWQLMQEKYSLAMHNTGSLAPDEIAALDHEQVSERSMAMIDRFIKDGRISNARIVQITNELKELRHKRPAIPNIKENTVRMYAVNALLEYLYGGTAAQDKYLLSAIAADGQIYAKEIEALRATIAKAALTDADRTAVVRCIAAYAPIKGTDNAKAFYELRKRVYAAYPIEWLSKCDI